MKLKDIARGIIVGLAGGAVGYVVGGVAAPYITGVSAPAYAAIGFLLGFATILVK